MSVLTGCQSRLCEKERPNASRGSRFARGAEAKRMAEGPRGTRRAPHDAALTHGRRSPTLEVVSRPSTNASPSRTCAAFRTQRRSPSSAAHRAFGKRKPFLSFRHVRRFVDDRNRGCRPRGSAPSPRGEARRRGRPQDRPRQRVGRRAPPRGRYARVPRPRRARRPIHIHRARGTFADGSLIAPRFPPVVVSLLDAPLKPQIRFD